MKNKSRGLIFYIKNIKDNDLYIKVLSSNDVIESGIVYGGNSSKKKMIYQSGYFIEYSSIKKNVNSPLIFTSDVCRPFLGDVFNDKYKMNALLSILSLINSSIMEGQKIKGLYYDLEKLISNIINKKHWLILYCEWLFHLLKQIGYQVDYHNNINNKYFDISIQEFTNKSHLNSIEFPHNLLINKKKINYKNINTIFTIFESIYIKNHLDNINYKMPLNFINFKKIILLRLK
jgi:recombinational DNA repair protein (RecF pathway)